VKESSDSVQDQIFSCLRAVDGLNRCIRGRNWTRLAERNKRLDSEMGHLRLLVEALSNPDEQLLNQLKNLNLQFRRSQRQLSSQIGVAGSDIESLEKGMRKVAMIKEALES